MKLLIKPIALFIILSLLAFIFSSCGNKNGDSDTTTEEAPILSTTAGETTTKNTTLSAEAGNTDGIKIDTYIILDNEHTTISGSGATFENNILTINQSGTYSLEGTLTDGKIYINSPDEEKKVKLLLNGVSVSCSTDAPLFVENSPKETILILADGSVNNFSDTAREVPTDENADYATAAIYAKDDLQIEGTGTLNVNGNFNKGIFSKNDIDIQDGNINITSVDDGIRGKESVEILGGTINITAGGDGIRTNETEEAEKGNIEISGGTITIASELDCIQSVKDLTVTGGIFKLTSNGGATETASTSDSMGDMGGMGPMGGGGGGRGGKGGGMFDMYGAGQRPGDSSASEAENEDTPSTKGIKADGKMTISGGEIIVSSVDDCIHAINIDIIGGTFNLKSDDDGVHADETVTISNADINVNYSYEGIEGTVINIDSGSVSVVAADDGFNAAGDSGSSMNPMAADYSCEINVSGGYIHIDADGDGVDSNGNVNQTGGTIIVFGPQNGGNGALDYGGTYTVSGGTLLALGAQGMAQSVSGDGVDVLAFTYSCQADTLNTITDKNGNSLIGFKSPKSFGTVVFASDKIKQGETYSVYSGGEYSTDGENGVWLEGEYTKGTLVGSLS
ncbi:MAG: carbohydrate-binding domain-containing protein [Clostridia bacterium]|nr:carbohydrate-binding domain-containing protein [Clostridia bacterium]